MFESHAEKGCLLCKGTKSDLQPLSTCLAFKCIVIPKRSKVVRKINACMMIAIFCCGRPRCRFEEPRDFGMKLALGSSSDNKGSAMSCFGDAIPRLFCQRFWKILS